MKVHRQASLTVDLEIFMLKNFCFKFSCKNIFMVSDTHETFLVVLD